MAEANSIEFEKADDGTLISHTRHNSGDGPYVKPKVHTHRSIAHAQKHLGSVFTKKAGRKSKGSKMGREKTTHR